MFNNQRQALHRPLPATALRLAWMECRGLLITAAALSLGTNVLMLAQPLYMLQIYDRVLTTGHVETLIALSVIVFAVFGVFGALDACRNMLLSRIGAWLEKRVSPELFEVGIRARLHGDAGGAQPLREMSTIRSFVGAHGLGTFFDAPWAPLFLVLLWILHPWLGTLGVVAAVLLIILAVATEYATREPLTAASKALIVANAYAEAAIRNAEAILAMGMRAALRDRWQVHQDQAVRSSEAANDRMSVLMAFTKVARFGAQMGGLGLGALLVIRQELTPGSMIACSIILARALSPIEQAMGAWRSFTNARLAQSRVNERLEAFPRQPTRIRLPEPVGEVIVDHVSYQPHGSRRPIIDNISFRLSPGEAIAVIGPSAAGKSSLCRLLIGIYAPSSGSIRLDGAELRTWDPEALGSSMGYLPQDVELFGGSVRENIARMRENATDEDIVAAARLAHAHEMILQLENGYETQVGDGGARLSGGQRQQVGLARALFKSPKLIVLDEPNANLDQAGEAALAAAISDLKSRGAAILMVGHRPSTLHEVDRIMVLQHGRITGLGPRESVLSQLRKPKAERRTTAKALVTHDGETR